MFNLLLYPILDQQSCVRFMICRGIGTLCAHRGVHAAEEATGDGG